MVGPHSTPAALLRDATLLRQHKPREFDGPPPLELPTRSDCERCLYGLRGEDRSRQFVCEMVDLVPLRERFEEGPRRDGHA